MLTKSSKAKGRRLQNLVANTIREVLRWEVRPAIMGEKGSDIKGETYSFDIECKNNEKISMWGAWEQVKNRSGSISESTVPILIMSRNRQKEPLVVMEFNMFINLLRNGGYANEDIKK